MKAFIFALIVTCGIAAFVSADPSWTNLRGTFQLLQSDAFGPFPRTIREPLFTQENWVATSDTEDDCTNGGKFNGIQYIRNNEYSVGLLFDVNGVIAGIQMLFRHTDVLSEDNTLRYDQVTMYNNVTYNNETYFALTAYFVNPSIICTTGRSDSDLPVDGTGTGLWIQNGTGPGSILEVPHARPEGNDAVESGWTQNNCFLAMGFHNFYRQNEYESTDCTLMDPIFGLYNRNKELMGFGFITPGTLNSTRFEHPPPAAIRMILGNTPQCVLDIQAKIGVSSLHVYFGPYPWLLTCPLLNSIPYVSSVRNWISSIG